MRQQVIPASLIRQCVTMLGVAVFFLISLLMTFTVARADTIVVTDHIPSQNTNWVNELLIPAFDPEWGALTAVTLTFETPITASIRYENISAERVSITSNHAVSLSLLLPDGTVLKSLPSAVRIDKVPPFDGIPDYGGSSGASFEMTATMVITRVFSTPEELALFSRNEPIRFPITATGASQILGPGNFDAIFRAQAASAGISMYFLYRAPEFVVEKMTNQRDADDANGNDVPVIAPGAPITWTYLITNIGNKVIPFADITVNDSDPNVIPIFDAASDDGDRLLSPGEVWRYYAVGTALDLRLEYTDTLTVDGCRGSVAPQTLRAYQNTVSVKIEDIIHRDSSHYCNPTPRRLLAAIEFAKLINRNDANDPNDPDIPYVFPGTVLEWTYLITNTGSISFTFAEIHLEDDDESLTIVFDSTSDNGDQMLAPGETWRYVASGIARNLLFDTAEITIVPGCDPMQSGASAMAYRNMATVIIRDLEMSDPGHYCNFPPTVVPAEPDTRKWLHFLYMPLVTN